ncbi:MAG: patatin family protein [Defluviitaleaceae bacterium]|nr:patatin family protein [Defluviitaleaceae bacterium]
MKFSQPIIKGIPHKKILPQGTALVLEGGGTRGFYSAGVFEAFMDAEIIFPYIVGVSAGAANVLTYIAGQRGRNRLIVEKYVGEKKYLSFGNFIKHGSLFGYDYIFKTLPEQHIFFDHEIFERTEINFFTGATDCVTGKTIWFGKNEIAHGFDVTVASCSVPFLSKIVCRDGLHLLDGGITSPIPIEKSIADGNNFHVIVLTQNQGYIKSAFRHKKILRIFYRKYPALVDAILKRHEVYNRQLALCEQLERDGKAKIIRPLVPLSINRATTNVKKLLALYDEGHAEGKNALAGIEF